MNCNLETPNPAIGNYFNLHGLKTGTYTINIAPVGGQEVKTIPTEIFGGTDKDLGTITINAD